ncbi:unnamed protein product [Miscanthus lutarioriparius]|uniref:non-specific serine/threonine protein kinase n=1 Tax=Miscanthus lutarioriparius TaxID=422564 RepID=A0A811NT20_9POAL|nr:unnamed protein product [Miscanthus lutarioriparius]
MGTARMAAPVAMLLLLHHLACAVAAGTEAEAAALLAFKIASVTADPGGRLVSWAEVNSTSGTSSPCKWTGVSCTDGHVHMLNLSGMSLVGCLHLDPLLALPALRTILLRGNAFHGNLTNGASQRQTSPPCMLMDVDLSSNAFNGTLPQAFLESCSNLQLLNLSRNTLTGGGFPFPPSLQTLDMSRNKLSDAGLLNYSLAACHGIQFLNLSANQLMGGLLEFARCSQVSVLDLSGNLMSGALPGRLLVTAPTNLTHLSIAGNNISGDISKYEFGGCPNLRVLDWSYNRLSAMGLPPSLANCRRLKTIDMSGNKLLSGSIPEFLGGFHALRRLALARNNFTAEIPDKLSLLCRIGMLVELDLSSNQLIGSLPASFSSCRSLEVLDLGSNQLFGDFVVTVISKMSSLRVLRLPFNNINGTNPLPALAAGCPLLEVIDLGSNLLEGEIMPDLCSSLPSLRKLLLPDNYFSGTVPLSLGNCSNLESLDLSFNLLVGHIPSQVILLPKLADLVMWANNLSGEIPDVVCSNSTRLETLVISYNNFTGVLPPSITSCVNLIWLSLAGNSLTGNVPSGFGNLQKLAILQLHKIYSLAQFQQSLLAAQTGLVTGGILSGKQFAYLRNEAGNICPGAGVLFEFFDIRPERLAQFPAVHSCGSTRIYTGVIAYTFNKSGSMIVLDLSYNRFTGTIPASLGNMTYLTVLNLGHNDLTGAIPDAFMGLRAIGVMDLSHNHLTGGIPAGLGSLSFLADFDVSNNNLTGEIPISGQLITFPASRFANNSGLCGILLDRCMPNTSPGLMPQYFPDQKSPLVFQAGFGEGFGFGFVIAIGLVTLLQFKYEQCSCSMPMW